MAYGIDSVDLIFEDMEEKSQKAINNLDSELKTIRAGRANAHILDKVVVPYYDTIINAGNGYFICSNITDAINDMKGVVDEARLLVIKPYDRNVLKDVEKAIIAANTGINPVNDGNVIRLAFPQVTEERRRDLCKQIKKLAEETIVVLRNARRSANDELKALEKDSEITEDDLKDFLKDVDKVLEKKIETVEELQKAKEAEVMEV